MCGDKTKEKQYQFMVDMTNEKGPIKMSVRASTMWRIDPKRLSFTLSRHKFISKMLSGYNRILEIGCGDAFASRIVHPEVKELHAIDFDPVFINEAIKMTDSEWPVVFAVHDIILDGPYLNGGLFDAAFSLDVIEHINIENESVYLENISQSLKPGGVFICGSPSLESQSYASPESVAGHVNCKSGNDLRQLLLKYFDHAFLFGMNDEVLHTGLPQMSHYNFVLAVGNKVA